MSIILMLVGLFLLIKCADLFVDGCSSLAKSLGIPSLIIGLTIVAFGTSAPETAVSVTASIKGLNDISIGNVVGSNICNLLLILGICGLLGKLKSSTNIIVRDFPYQILSSIIMVILTFSFFVMGDGQGVIGLTEGLILLSFFLIYLYYLAMDGIKSRQKENKEKFTFKSVLYIIIGLVGIVFGGELVVNSATEIASLLNVSQSVIALTIVAVGTSLPELVTSVVATKKGEVDIAIGNIVGSNIYNIFFILGISSIVNPIIFDFNSFIDILVMLFAGIETYLLFLKGKNLDKKKGIFLLSTYLVYLIYILIR